MNKAGPGLRAHLITILVWTAIILVVIGFILSNRATQARQIAALSSPSRATRDSMVLALVRSDSLVEVLTNTEDPNSDATSPQNVKSAAIREHAANSVNRLSASGAITVSQAMDTMFQLSKDADTTVQTTAENGLKALGEASDPNLDTIVAKLKDGDPGIRSAAVTVLGLIGTAPGFGDKTAKRVNGVINDPSSQASAESAMQGIGAPAVPYLAADMNAPTATLDFQLQIVNVMGAIATVNTIPQMTITAHSTQPALRHEAYVALANVVVGTDTLLQTDLAAPKTSPAVLTAAKQAFKQSKVSEPILLTALKNTNADSQTRSQVALALGDIATPAAINALVAALADYDTQVQDAAISGLQSVGAPAVAPLITALAQPNQQASASAAETLGEIGNPAAVAAVNKVLQNPATPASVRRSAAIGLGRSGSSSVIPTLVKALGDRNGDVEAAASDALLSPALAGSSIPALIQAFTQPTPVPFNAAQTLSRMGNEAVPQLEQAAKSSQPGTQAWAAIALGATSSKDPSIVAALQPLTASPNTEVKFAATQALNSLAGG